MDILEWYKKVFDVFEEYFDNEQCLKHVGQIYQSDRWFDFSHFRETADYCAEQMKRTGLCEVDMLELSADGRTAYGDWVMPRAWDVSGGILKAVCSDGAEIMLADYKETPACLMMYSAPTPPGGVEAEIVLVDDPSRVDCAEVKGRFIFTDKAPKDVISLARKGGALGIISDYLPVFLGARDSRDDCKDAFRWENNFIYPLNDTGLFGFSLSLRAGCGLRELIDRSAKQGKAIQLCAEVNTRFYDGIVYTVSGLIPGTCLPAEEVMICGHLYEPGANDNASGCGVILELAAVLQKGISEGKLPKPSRSIRFVMGFECIGLMGYYINYHERISRAIGAINVDMIGSSAEDKAKLHIWHNPLSNWSFTDMLLPSLIRAYAGYSGTQIDFSETGFAIGDNLLADPMIGVPTVSMVMHPAESYHSSLDTLDRVDPMVLHRNGIIAGTFLCFLTMPEKSSSEWLLENIDNKIPSLMTDTSTGLNVFSEMEFEKISNDKLGDNASKMIPRRKITGTLSLHTLNSNFKENFQWLPFYNYHLNCPLFWTDGKRTLYEIACLTAIELKKDNFEQLLAELMEYYLFLEMLDYLYIERIPAISGSSGSDFVGKEGSVNINLNGKNVIKFNNIEGYKSR